MNNQIFRLTLLLMVAVVVPFNQLLAAQPYPVDTFLTNHGKKVTITCIKHGSLMITVDKQVIQVDPVAGYADYSTFPKATLVLITHEHGDHLDAKAVAQVSDNGTTVVANVSGAAKLEKATALKNGQQQAVSGGIVLKAVPAYNSTPERQQFHPKGNGNGYVLDVDGLRIYIAGDTEYIPEMESLKDVDVAFLPVNQPYTMTVEQAAKAARVILPKVLYPYHYGNTNLTSLADSLKETHIELRFRGME